MANAPERSTTVRTPHATALVAALAARDLPFDLVGPDLVQVHDIAADDLGWIAAGAGVVVYEMVTRQIG
jgi:hypothetical protein